MNLYPTLTKYLKPMPGKPKPLSPTSLQGLHLNINPDKQARIVKLRKFDTTAACTKLFQSHDVWE